VLKKSCRNYVLAVICQAGRDLFDSAEALKGGDIGVNKIVFPVVY
jgi:hypothetical protein